MKQNRISEEEVGTMLEEAFEGEPFERIEPPPRFGVFFRRGVARESLIERLRRFLVIPSIPRRLAFSGAVVAVLLLVLFPLMPGDGVPTGTYRDGGVAEAIELPRGRLAAAPGSLQWPVTAGAISYRVELSNQDGTLLWEGETKTTTVELPATLFAERPVGSEYRVRVTGVGPDGAVAGQQSSRFLILP